MNNKQSKQEIKPITLLKKENIKNLKNGLWIDFTNKKFFSNKPSNRFSGFYIEWWNIHQKNILVPYKNGYRHGIEKNFFKSGKIKYHCVWIKNEKNGQYEIFYINGILKEKGFYKNNKKHGNVKSYNISGKLEKLKKYNNGVIVS